MASMVMTRSATLVASRHPEAPVRMRLALGCVFKMWTALELALFHQWGGAEGGIAAADLQEELMAMFISPEKVYKDDVALVLEDYMDTHFKTICDDGSPDELGELLCTLWRKCCEGDFSMCDQLHAQTISRSAVTNISVSQSTGLHAGDAIDSDSDGSDEDNDAAERMLHEAYREARAGAGAGGDLGSIDEHDEGGEMDTETSAPALEPLEPLVDKEGFETVVVGKKKKAYKKV